MKWCGVKDHFKRNYPSLLVDEWQMGDTIDQVDHTHDYILTDQHGRSQVLLDRKLAPEFENETILLLTPVGNSKDEFRRVGNAGHQHEVMKQFEGNRDELFVAMENKKAKVTLLRHFTLPCPAGAEQKNH
jgi:hypothetical protein